ncbi:type I-MYXAN CRISPR-associated Cas8a1/Cmx1 [Desulfocurvibacter africanus]|uniref:type I-MYXAN CRISPR-associated Cas8a1/Cmx1 n=1 Tax=Desulfocurvibacter africanus TaxID=873 RepID=UPI002FD92547
MGKKNALQAVDEPKSESWSLDEPGLGVLERAGLAGLYLALSAVDGWAAQGDEKATVLRETLEWELSDREVRLAWKGKPREALGGLLRWAWQVKDGVLFLPGVHRTRDSLENKWLRLGPHKGILQTFFQHNKVLPKGEQVRELCSLDEQETFEIAYRPVKGELPPCKDSNIKGIVQMKGFAGDKASLPSWAHPGSAQRFGKMESGWIGTGRLAFLLLFSPLACVYFELPRSRVRDRNKLQMTANWAFLVPEFTDLSAMAASIADVTSIAKDEFLRIRAQSMEDAALRFAASYMGKRLEKNFDITALHIVAMGKVSHYQGQNVRKRVIRLAPDMLALRRYLKLLAVMPNAVRQRKNQGEEENKGSHFIAVPLCRGLIARNLIDGAPWYTGLGEPDEMQRDEVENSLDWERKRDNKGISRERYWFNKLFWERRSLMELASDESMWDEQREAAFVKVFHDALRKLLTKEEDATKRGGSRSFHERWEHRVEDIRRGLMRAKTQMLLRKLVTELLAEAGGGKSLTENGASLWQYLNHPFHWQRTRDLLLLSLVTFTDKRLADSDNSKQGE